MSHTTATENHGNRRAIVVGAGLVGSMAALFLSHQPHFKRLFPDGVHIYERRSDSRKETVERGRSINLAVSDRTFRTLRQLFGDDLGERLIKELHQNGIRMFGRHIHFANRDGSGETQCKFMPYGRPEQYILSIDRKWLNEWLLSAAEERGVKAHFNMRCVRVEPLNSESRVRVTFVDEASGEESLRHTVEGRFVFGCDGLNSAVRQQLQKNPAVRMNFSHTYITHGYRELKIPPTASGQFAMRSDSLHIWPRKDFMIIALPNPTKDFTVTLFAPYKGPNSFSELNTDEKVIAFFKREFPDALDYMGEELLLELWNTNPMCTLSYIKTKPFHYEDLVLLMGDAAHAVIPFYGQGVNCGFEDIRYFDNIVSEIVQKLENMGPIDDEDAALSELLKDGLERYTAIRKPSADAICELSLYNFTEMQASTASPLFHLTRNLGILLHKLMPNTFLPLYSMVTFSPDIRYEEAWNLHKQRERNLRRVINVALGLATGSIAYAACRFGWPKLDKFISENDTVQNVLSKLRWNSNNS